MGIIKQVAGPVVIASDMRGTEMNELVEVGKDSLIGEVIELKDDTATIQVYEETSGIQPGEDVERTGEPLSVELGPGLIGTIFDGIQRPLTQIQNKVGAFIERGVQTNSLPRDKEWKFEPSDLSTGDKVEAGTILGTVEETSMIVHKIMVPPSVEEGELVELASEGEYTVEETIAKVETDDGEEEVNMVQEWPVRKPRPYQNKLDPNIPLTSGQRVIDTFFPVAKGGTAAIPGGFGTGKCVVGETPIILADGSVKPIEEVYEENKDRGERTVKANEEYTELEDPIKILSMGDGEIVEKEATHVYKGMTDSTKVIETESGRKVELTPVHKLFVLTQDMNIIEKQAKDLEKGDTLLIPRKIPGKENSPEINVNESLPEKRVCNEDFEKVREAIEKLSEELGSRKNLSKKLEISEEVLAEYALGRNRPTVQVSSKIFDLAGWDHEIRTVKGEKNSKKVEIPQEMSEELSEFLGLLLGDGSLKPGSVHFYNNNEKLLSRFEKLVDEIFDLETEREFARTVKSVKVNSRVLKDFLVSLGFPEEKKSNNCSVPEKVLQSSETAIGSFLKGYYLADGSFNKYEIEISTASKGMAQDLTYCLARIGASSRLREKEIEDAEYYRVKVSGSELEQFYEKTNSSHEKYDEILEYLEESDDHFKGSDSVRISPEVVRENFEKSEKSRKDFKDKGIKIANYTTQRENMSVPLLQRFSEITDNRELKKVAQNHLNHFMPDQIKSVKTIEKTKPVYDVTVPETHNFVGGNAPMVLHNTVMLHQIARWSDTQIVVYVGCGERGNEMTDVILHFPELEDPRTGNPIIDRTSLIANTSNMPVAAREASIYTGITIAEYFRDMGYHVALMADSTSRWAEALREISGRLEEMPSEEGYPAYLGSRLADFYERAGRVKTKGREDRKGSVTVMGAVSPPGGDFSEPVTQNTLRIIKTFWALDSDLADERHFPAINWLESYSGYLDRVDTWWEENVGEGWKENRNRAMEILQEEDELREIVQLVGPDALPERDRAVLEASKVIREDYLQQNAMHEVDTYCSPKKQLEMFDIALKFYDETVGAVEEGASVEEVTRIPIRGKIARMKRFPEEKFEEEAEKIKESIENQVEKVLSGEEIETIDREEEE